MSCIPIRTTKDLKERLRAGRYTSIGSYPLFFVTFDGAALSFETVRENLREVFSAIRDERNDGWRVCYCAVNWENPALFCEHSGKRIESAYAEDDVDDLRELNERDN